MRRGTLLIALGLIAACGRDALPPKITIEQVVTELAPPLAPGASVTGVAAEDVRRAVLQPGYRAGCGAPHDALVTPPGAAVHFRLQVPPDAAGDAADRTWLDRRLRARRAAAEDH
ncbi:MAG TPA: hypothetical protein VJ829_12415, partial [Candidatus Binatia bacterium]|nr:hypothetical protein [Candidatus Binatia bacterium]